MTACQVISVSFLGRTWVSKTCSSSNAAYSLRSPLQYDRLITGLSARWMVYKSSAAPATWTSCSS